MHVVHCGEQKGVMKAEQPLEYLETMEGKMPCTPTATLAKSGSHHRAVDDHVLAATPGECAAPPNLGTSE